MATFLRTDVLQFSGLYQFSAGRFNRVHRAANNSSGLGKCHIKVLPQ